MTPPQILSRSQRRMEKKQALALLGLVLGVALVSFVLGVLVGRSGAPVAAVPPPSSATPRVAVNRDQAPVGEATPPGGSAVTADPQQHVAEKLTFYETLPKGEQPPLGSGINLAPTTEGALPAVAAGSAVAVSPPPAKTVTSPAPPTRAAKEPSSGPSVTVSAGDYVVQVAAFRQVQDAAGLARKLAGKGFPAYVEQIDLGGKGIWQRVYVGPFSGDEPAKRVAARLRAEEKLSPLVKKR